MSLNPTSEEKLLKLIRNRDSEKSNKATREKSSNRMKLFSGGPLGGRVFLRIIDGVVVLLILLILYLVFYVGYKFWNVQTNTSIELSASDTLDKKQQLSELAQLVTPKSFDVYRPKLSKRNLFVAAEKKVEQENLKSQKLTQEGWILVGVLMGEVPQAVVENEKTAETFFLSKDEFIGDAKLIGIYEEKVIFSIEGESIELSR